MPDKKPCYRKCCGKKIDSEELIKKCPDCGADLRPMRCSVCHKLGHIWCTATPKLK